MTHPNLRPADHYTQIHLTVRDVDGLITQNPLVLFVHCICPAMRPIPPVQIALSFFVLLRAGIGHMEPSVCRVRHKLAILLIHFYMQSSLSDLAVRI